MLCVLFCHPFGAGSLLILSQGLHPWLYPFSPSGLSLSRCRGMLLYAPTRKREKCRRRLNL